MYSTTGQKNERLDMRNVLWVALSGVLLIQISSADDRNVAESFLKSKLDAVIEVLQNKDIEQQNKLSKIDEIVSPMFDFRLMAKLSLGKEYWPKLSEQNKERFTGLFVKRMKKTYFNKLTLYTDEKIVYDQAIQVQEKIQIHTYLKAKDEKTSITYKLYSLDGNWKIYDIEIEGVSILRSYSAQFREILKTNTIDDLLLRLEKREHG
jgi:phospholipid transport system substrate-binding protein